MEKYQGQRLIITALLINGEKALDFPNGKYAADIPN